MTSQHVAATHRSLATCQNRLTHTPPEFRRVRTHPETIWNPCGDSLSAVAPGDHMSKYKRNFGTDEFETSGTSRFHELHESKPSSVSLIKFIRYQLPYLFAHAIGVKRFSWAVWWAGKHSSLNLAPAAPPGGPMAHHRRRPGLFGARAATAGQRQPVGWDRGPLPAGTVTANRDTWAEKIESLKRMNSLRETIESIHSCNSCKRLETFLCFTYRIYPFWTFELFCSCIRGQGRDLPAWQHVPCARKYFRWAFMSRALEQHVDFLRCSRSLLQ